MELSLVTAKHMPHARRMILSRLMSGGMLTAERLARWAERDGRPQLDDRPGICTHCNWEELESEEHVLWRCPAWAGARRVCLPSGTPSCFLNAGWITTSMQVSAGFAKQVHGQMVDIYLLRIAARERDAEATARDATSR
eukprot:2570537-Amphidinium_carterae.1